MMAPLRVLLLHEPGDDASWRVAFDLIQAAAALDMPLQLALAGRGLEWLGPPQAGNAPCAASRALSSLQLIGIEQVLAPGPIPESLALLDSALQVSWLDAISWRTWLRQAPLQVW